MSERLQKLKESFIVRKIGDFQLLIPEPIQWITASAFRTSDQGTVVMNGKEVLFWHERVLSLDALNMTNGWIDPMLTLRVEEITNESEKWLIQNTKRLYTFEREYLSHEQMTFEKALIWAYDILQDLNVPFQPFFGMTSKKSSKCRVTRLGRFGEAIKATIHLTSHDNRNVYRYHVLHEIAHFAEYLNYRCLRHGVGFTRTYAKILSDYEMCKIPRQKMRESGLIFEHK